MYFHKQVVAPSSIFVCKLRGGPRAPSNLVYFNIWRYSKYIDRIIADGGAIHQRHSLASRSTRSGEMSAETRRLGRCETEEGSLLRWVRGCSMMASNMSFCMFVLCFLYPLSFWHFCHGASMADYDTSPSPHF